MQNRIRFADGQLDDVATILVGASEYGAQYLEQAPVLAVLTCGKLGSHITYGELDRFSNLLAASPRLKVVMAEYGATAPMRKIAPSALRIRDRSAIEILAKLDASTLSQCIPSESQRVWLDAIGKWLRLMPETKKARANFGVAWIARRLAEDLSRYEQVDAIIDWIGRGHGILNEKWTWERAIADVEAWHRSLRDEAALRALAAAEKQRASFDTVICKAPIPEAVTVDGYDFVALRTLRKLREEGQVMHHCVASYANDVRKGRCAIVSIRKDGVNIATLEISGAGVIAQLKAHCNRTVDAAVRAACDTFALLHWRPEPKVA